MTSLLSSSWMQFSDLYSWWSWNLNNNFNFQDLLSIAKRNIENLLNELNVSRDEEILRVLILVTAVLG